MICLFSFCFTYLGIEIFICYIFFSFFILEWVLQFLNIFSLHILGLPWGSLIQCLLQLCAIDHFWLICLKSDFPPHWARWCTQLSSDLPLKRSLALDRGKHPEVTWSPESCEQKQVIMWIRDWKRRCDPLLTAKSLLIVKNSEKTEPSIKMRITKQL